MDRKELNPQQRAELQQLLDRREKELEQTITGLRQTLAAPSAEVRDSVEDGDARMSASVDLVQLQRQEEELREIRHARDRMRSGDYGRCETCDEPIAFERLKIRPAARFCLQHEEAWEKAHPGATVAM
jgi:DnaK suppressor protein